MLSQNSKIYEDFKNILQNYFISQFKQEKSDFNTLCEFEISTIFNHIITSYSNSLYESALDEIINNIKNNTFNYDKEYSYKILKYFMENNFIKKMNYNNTDNSLFNEEGCININTSFNYLYIFINPESSLNSCFLPLLLISYFNNKNIFIPSKILEIITNTEYNFIYHNKIKNLNIFRNRFYLKTKDIFILKKRQKKSNSELEEDKDIKYLSLENENCLFELLYNFVAITLDKHLIDVHSIAPAVICFNDKTNLIDILENSIHAYDKIYNFKIEEMKNNINLFVEFNKCLENLRIDLDLYKHNFNTADIKLNNLLDNIWDKCVDILFLYKCVNNSTDINLKNSLNTTIFLDLINKNRIDDIIKEFDDSFWNCTNKTLHNYYVDMFGKFLSLCEYNTFKIVFYYFIQSYFIETNYSDNKKNKLYDLLKIDIKKLILKYTTLNNYITINEDDSDEIVLNTFEKLNLSQKNIDEFEFYSDESKEYFINNFIKKRNIDTSLISNQIVSNINEFNKQVKKDKRNNRDRKRYKRNINLKHMQ